MTHDYHEELPGYREGQLLIDGCAECEHRGANPLFALTTLDHERFAAAWERGAAWNQERIDSSEISKAEAKMLETLWTVQVCLERQGWPIGRCPGRDSFRELVTGR